MCKDNQGSTPLHDAAHNGHLDVSQCLMLTDGSTPLHNACWNGHLDVAQYLITQHKCDTMCKDNQSFTPLHVAAYNGHLNVVRYLINECNCDPMCKAHGYTPLYFAIDKSHHHVIEYLISNMSLYCRMLYHFLENENTVVHRVDKLCHLMAARKVSESYYVPQAQEEILETLSTLHSTGLITFLNNEHTPGNSWVVVDKRVLLDNINGVLFAPGTMQNISSNTGEIIRCIELWYCYICIV